MDGMESRMDAACERNENVDPLDLAISRIKEIEDQLLDIVDEVYHHGYEDSTNRFVKGCATSIEPTPLMLVQGVSSRLTTAERRIKQLEQELDDILLENSGLCDEQGELREQLAESLQEIERLKFAQDGVDKLLGTIEEYKNRLAWKPMESAPKDGGPVLFCKLGVNGKYIYKLAAWDFEDFIIRGTNIVLMTDEVEWMRPWEEQ